MLFHILKKKISAQASTSNVFMDNMDNLNMPNLSPQQENLLNVIAEAFKNKSIAPFLFVTFLR
jgi:hypothetical protein